MQIIGSTENELCTLLHITNIVDVDMYTTSLHDFEEAVKTFYEFGSTTLLTKTRSGDEETFYMHVLRFYIPVIDQNTVSNHRLDVGVFTMKGFERQNR